MMRSVKRVSEKTRRIAGPSERPRLAAQLPRAAGDGAEGLPLPWHSYRCIAFLVPRVRKKWHVFEFGSGNSTLWWSARVASVTSCEHNLDWFRAMQAKVPANVELIHREEGPAYWSEILNHDRRYNVVVVDGRDRNDCAKTAPQRLTGNGVIIWDNAELKRYKPGFAHLQGLNFRKLDFTGFGPAQSRPWMTSILYRDGNCLGL
jgi:hypothetical protein